MTTIIHFFQLPIYFLPQLYTLMHPPSIKNRLSKINTLDLTWKW